MTRSSGSAATATATSGSRVTATATAPMTSTRRLRSGDVPLTRHTSLQQRDRLPAARRPLDVVDAAEVARAVEQRGRLLTREAEQDDAGGRVGQVGRELGERRVGRF